MAHKFSHDVFSPQGLFIHTSCENCGAISKTDEARADCPHPLKISSGKFIYNHYINILNFEL